jgi:hypothetical protein
VDELTARIALLEAEIARTARHRDKAGRTRAAADALFGARPPAPPLPAKPDDEQCRPSPCGAASPYSGSDP